MSTGEHHKRELNYVMNGRAKLVPPRRPAFFWVHHRQRIEDLARIFHETQLVLKFLDAFACLTQITVCTRCETCMASCINERLGLPTGATFATEPQTPERVTGHFRR